MQVEALLAPAEYRQLAPGVIPEGTVVVTADGRHIGTVLRTWTTDDGALYGDVDVDDSEEEGVGRIYATSCPYCEALCLAGASNEIEHMKREHPEIIERRLLDAGFVKDANGEWVDTLAGDG